MEIVNEDANDEYTSKAEGHGNIAVSDAACSSFGRLVDTNSPPRRLIERQQRRLGVALNPVQTSIQTKNLAVASSYDLVAYNSTGFPVASYSGQYASVTFELPSWTHIFAANANGPSPAQSPICIASSQSGQAGAGVASPPAQTKASSNAAIAYPCYSSPPSEYGYSLTKISGSTSLTIATQSPAAVPTQAISVTVSYKNGTAVSDAYVSADVVGNYYYWGGVSKVTMYTQTGADGVAHIVVPAVPVTVTASKSVEVNLPKNQSTTQVSVGGQLVNVTLFYSPDYVYLGASALLIPPQTSLGMVVTAQPSYPVIPYAVGSADLGQPVSNAVPPGSAREAQDVVGVQNSASSSLTSRIATIPPIPASDLGPLTPRQPASKDQSINLWVIGTIAMAGAISAVVGIAIKAKH
jgi:hypothetical protein